MDRYESIWADRSPFEIIVEEQGEPEEVPPPFEDYSLAGYSKRGDIWRVTVVNIKDPKEKHHLETGKVTPEGFELLNVNPERNYKETEIVVRRGGKSGPIGFSDKYVKPASFAGGKPAGAPKVVGKPRRNNPNQPNQPNQRNQPNQPNQAAPPGLGNQPQAPGNAAAGNEKADAAAKIRKMLQNRAGGANNAAGNAQEGAKREPRRRVILPPSR